MKTWMVTVASLLVAGGTAKGEFTSGLINVDFNFTAQSFNQTGPALLGAAGDVWNSELSSQPHTTGVLTLATGVQSTGVTYSLTGVDRASVGGGPFLVTPYNALMSDGYGVLPGNTMTITLNGLTPLQTYDLYLYSDETGNDGRTSTFAIGGSSRTANNVGALGIFVEGNNYAHFPSQPADAAGHISIAIQGVGGTGQFVSPGGFVNGFQISAVPEPATIVSLAIGGLSLTALGSRQWTGKKPRRASNG